MFVNGLLKWMRMYPEVVAWDDAANSLGMAGLANPVDVGRGVRVEFRPLRNSTNPLLLAFDASGDTSGLEINAGWQFCHFALAGTEPPLGDRKLRKWDPANTAAEYASWVGDLHTRLQPVKGDPLGPDLLDRRLRLEGVVGFVDKDENVFWDRVQIFHVQDALEEPGPNGSHDWIAWKVQFINQFVVEEGGGHGPPH